MRIGLICRADRSGLGYQTRALAKLLKPSKVMIIDSTPFNSREQNFQWYKDIPDRTISHGFITDEEAKDWLEGMDILVTCEIPYNDKLFAIARQRGIKTVLQPNPEFNLHFQNKHLPKPDAFFLPSSWYQKETEYLLKSYYCPPPIDLRPRFKPVDKKPGSLNILHIAGRRAAFNRNGTDLLLKAAQDVPGLNVTIINQQQNDIIEQADMYDGDYHIMVLPRRYGGLCLPMLESLGYGLPVIMPDISPNNSILPKDWLVATDQSGRFNAKRVVTMFRTNPSSLRNKLIQFRDMSNKEYQEHRKEALSIYNHYQEGLENWHIYLEDVLNTK